MIPLWVIFSLVSNVAIIATEFQNRSARNGWGEVLWTTAPLIFIAQFCLFKAYNGAPHWFSAWMVFTVGNSIMRVGGVGLFTPDEVSSWSRTVAGVCVMLAGAFLVKGGLK